MKHRFATAIDIGTSSVKTLIATQAQDGGKIKILGKGETPSSGLRRGEVDNLGEVTAVVNDSLSQAQKESGIKVRSCVCSINGSHLFSTLSQGLVSVSRADQKISTEDIERVIHQAENINLPSNKEILESLPIEFIVDGEKGIQKALGLQGARLEAKVLLICAFSPVMENLTKSVLNAGLKINDIIPSSLASAEACLTHREKELGVVLVDIGSTTLGISVFEEGHLIDFAVFPLGSANITNDIALGLRVDIDTAERIKKEFVVAAHQRTKTRSLKKKQQQTKIRVSEKPFSFSKKVLQNIVELRLSDIFEQVQKELKKVSRQELLPGGVVLTGGGAKLKGIADYAKRKLKLPSRIGFPLGVEGVEKDPSFSAAAGLLFSEVEELPNIKAGEQNHSGFFRKIKNIFNIFKT